MMFFVNKHTAVTIVPCLHTTDNVELNKPFSNSLIKYLIFNQQNNTGDDKQDKVHISNIHEDENKFAML